MSFAVASSLSLHMPGAEAIIHISVQGDMGLVPV